MGKIYILGVWSGDLIIENVSINPDIIETFDFPLKIIHSSIGRLKIKVPWSKLSSESVEIFFEDIFLIVSPVDL